MHACSAELQSYRKQKTNEILNLNNRIARLKKELEQLEAECFMQEAKKDYSLQVASQKTLEYGKVQASKAWLRAVQGVQRLNLHRGGSAKSLQTQEPAMV